MFASLFLLGAVTGGVVGSIGAEVIISQPIKGPVVSLLGGVLITARVEGDVIALAGDVKLGPGAEVTGDVVAVGGLISGSGAVGGRLVAVDRSLALTPSRLVSPTHGAVAFGLALLRLGLWLVLGGLAVIYAPAIIRAVGEQYYWQRAHALLLGLVSLVVWLSLVLLALIVVGAPIGTLILFIGVLGVFCAKFVGVVAFSWLVGNWLGRFLPLPLRGEMARSGAALMILVSLSAIPVFGAWLWFAISIMGIGAASGALILRVAPKLLVSRPIMR